VINSHERSEKPRQKMPEESDSNLVGPEDPERGNPPQHEKKKGKERLKTKP